MHLKPSSTPLKKEQELWGKGLGRCLSSFSVAVAKHHDPGDLKHLIGLRVRIHDSRRQDQLRTHILTLGMASEISKLTPSDSHAFRSSPHRSTN